MTQLAPKTVITAVGMVYDKKAQTVTLLNRVKVHYERPAAIQTKSAAKSAKVSKIQAKKMVLNPSKTLKTTAIKRRQAR